MRDLVLAYADHVRRRLGRRIKQDVDSFAALKCCLPIIYLFLSGRFSTNPQNNNEKKTTSSPRSDPQHKPSRPSAYVPTSSPSYPAPAYRVGHCGHALA